MTQVDTRPEAVDLHVGWRIRLRRKVMKMSQHQLGADLRLTFQQIQKYERGVNRVSASKLFEISRSLQTPVGYFFEGLDDHGALARDETAQTIGTLLACPEGLELAALFPRLKHGRARSSVLELVRAMAEDDEDAI